MDVTAKCSRRAAVLLASLSLLMSGCRRGEATAPPSALAAAGVAQCSLVPSQLRPLIVEWSGADRGSLEHRIRDGIVAVRYEGCALQIVDDCTVAGEYEYSGFNRKRDTIALETIDDLYQQVPIGAARLEQRLVRAGELSVDMTFVGMHSAGRSKFTRDELVGRCEAATHVLSAAQVGAFSFYSGAAEKLGERVTGGEVITTDGDPAACEAATSGDRAPPEGCGALIRLEFAPIGAAPWVAVAPRPAPVVEPSAAKRDRKPRSRRAGFLAGGGPGVGLVATGLVLYVGGLVSIGIWGAARHRANDISRAMGTFETDSAEWEALRERHEDVVLTRGVAGGMVGVCFGLGTLFMLPGLIVGDWGIASRVRVAPMVGRTNGLGVSLRF